MRLKRLAIVTAVTVAAVGAGSGIAFAVWTVQGSGTGAGAASVASSLTLTAVTPTGNAASLYPGGPAGPVDFTVTNPNPFAVTITSVTWGTPLSNNVTACANANISLDPGAPTSVSISIPANGTSPTVVVPGVLDLAHSAPNGCEGQSFTVPVTVSATQQ